MAAFLEHLTANGYAPNWREELNGLAPAFDHLLVRLRGSDIAVAAIIDCDVRPDAQVSAAPGVFWETARSCLDTAQGRAEIAIYLIGAGVLNGEITARLARYVHDAGRQGGVTAWVLDTLSHECWTNDASAGPRRAELRRLLAFPTTATPTAFAPTPRPPFFTFLLAAVLLAAYMATIILGRGGWSPPPAVWLFFGGLSRLTITGQFEWWRIFTAPLLHAAPWHIIGNVLILVWIGALLERTIGARWTAAAFACAALFGSIAGLLLHAPNMVSIGASGGLAGMVFVALCASSRVPRELGRTRLRLSAVGAAVLMFPYASSIGPMVVDTAAHIGGVVGGAAVATLLLNLWPRNQERPAWRRTAGAVAAIYFLVAISALAWRLRIIWWTLGYG